MDWTQLSQISELFGSVLSIDNEIVIIGATEYFKPYGLHKYDVENDKWNKLIKYPENLEICNTSISVDYGENQTNTLYILAEEVPFASYNLLKINLNKKSCKLLELIQVDDHEIVCGSSLFAMNNQLHIVGGRKNLRHLLYDENTQKLKVYNNINLSTDDIDIIHHIIGWWKTGLIYLKSQQKLLLFGGCLKDDDESTPTHDIFEYSMINKEWKKSVYKLPIEMEYFSYIITNDDNYIILFNAEYSKEQYSQYIYTLNTKTMKFRQSTIKTPIGEPVYRNKPDPYKTHSCIINYENDPYANLLISGYIKNKDTEYPSNDIIKLLMLFYGVEYVHFMNEICEHWKIHLNKILDDTFQI